MQTNRRMRAASSAYLRRTRRSEAGAGFARLLLGVGGVLVTGLLVMWLYKTQLEATDEAERHGETRERNVREQERRLRDDIDAAEQKMQERTQKQLDRYK